MSNLRRVTISLLAGSTALSLSACLTIPHGLVGKNGEDTAVRITRAIPSGSSEADTRRIMEAGGYRCSVAEESYSDPDTGLSTRGRLLLCSAAPGVSARGGFLFGDDYRVGFLVKDGQARLLFSVINITAS